MKLKNLVFLLFILGLFACNKQVPVEEYKLIPQPQSIEYANGYLKWNKSLEIAFDKDLSGEAELLKSYLNKDFGISSELKSGENKGNIILKLDPQFKSEKVDGYSLQVQSKSAILISNSATGIFYGIQSLRQIIMPDYEGFFVQQGTILDYPAFGWRAFMLDEGRHFKGKEVVKKMLDEMAYLKMNIFHWHLTEDQGWRIEIKKYPELTNIGAFRDSTEINGYNSNVYDGKPHGGFYTQDDIREIVAYAAERHINIVPEIEMPGHASAAIAAYPWLGAGGREIKVPGKFGVLDDIFNVSDPRVMQFLEDVLDEVIALFPYPVIHIGGDEVRYDQWKNSPQVKAYMAGNNLKTPAELQVFFTNNISNLLQKKGKKMMGWNDITGDKLHHYHADEDTGGQQQLAKGTIVHFWKGELDLIRRTTEKGFDIVNSFHEYTYLDYSYESISLSKAYSFTPIPEGLADNLKEKVLGSGCQMWCEFIPTVERLNEKVFPRIAAYAECGWTAPEKKDYSRFQTSLPNLTNHWEKEGINYGPTE